MDIGFVFEGAINVFKEFFGLSVSVFGNSVTFGQLFLFAFVSSSVLFAFRKLTG